MLKQFQRVRTVASIRVAEVRRWLIVHLATGEQIGIRAKFLIALLIFVVSFSVKSLVAVDLSPVMNTSAQPAGGMASEYDSRALSIVEGHGLLMPDNQDSSDTSLLAHAPGYSIFLSAVYSLFGKSYFNVQLVQNAINSITPSILFLFAGAMLGWRVGAVSGLLAAVSHHFSYYSNFVLPDSLYALPILVAVYLLSREKHPAQNNWTYTIAAGLIGISLWLRLNAVLLGPFLGIVLLLMSCRFRHDMKRALVLAFIPFLMITPITLRNYAIYGEFVLVQLGVGINLWEGLGEFGGREFGAVVNDHEVAEQEARLFNDPRYANTWQTPDGIKRDRHRVKRSLGVIIDHPFWYAGTVTRRIGEMFKYSAQAPLVFRSTDNDLLEAGERARARAAIESARRGQVNELVSMSPGGSLVFGRSISWTRPAVRAVQRITKETLLLFILTGLPIVFIVSARRGLFILLVPLYYVVVQGTLHTEFRYTLPMQYFVFVFAATSWVLIAASVSGTAKNLFRKTRKSANLDTL